MPVILTTEDERDIWMSAHLVRTAAQSEN
ncbi:hypothetical protein CHELA17_61363 [Chelatococcus asaccharovorans]|nr:hypothetical protein CHELA17_61363 [Chelatococcus asaccharovorans]